MTKDLRSIEKGVGLAADDLIRLLDSGMSVEQLFEYVMAKRSGRAVEN